MTPAQAQALLPNLTVRGVDATCEHAAQQSLLEAAESCSPRFEDAGSGEVYLDLGAAPPDLGRRASSPRASPPSFPTPPPSSPPARRRPSWRRCR
jgi:hypothetical protein